MIAQCACCIAVIEVTRKEARERGYTNGFDYITRIAGWKFKGWTYNQRIWECPSCDNNKVSTLSERRHIAIRRNSEE